MTGSNGTSGLSGISGTNGTNATATLPLSINTNVISISQATTSTNGYLSSTDWNTFNSKQPAGNYLINESDTLATVTGRGATTNTAITLGDSLYFSDSGLTKRGIQGTVGSNDFWFIGGGAVASNSGYLEIATGDDGQTVGVAEPIYVSQYGPGNPLTGTLYRRAKLLDESGNTYFPGILNVGTSNTNTTYNLFVTGSIYATADISAFSDQSVKNNIRPIDNALERVKQSRGVLYDRTDIVANDNIGFIAQELEVNFPELITTNTDGTKAVKYQNAVAILFEAVKELSKQIDELKSK